jgi:hypothetical protein
VRLGEVGHSAVHCNGPDSGVDASRLESDTRDSAGSRRMQADR